MGANKIGMIRDVWVSRLIRKKHSLYTFYWTLYVNLKLRIQGVKVGSGCTFWGNLLCNKFPGSTVKIGPRCRFRSTHWSNLVGINRPCALNTLTGRAVIKIGQGCGFSGTIIAAAESIEIDDETMCGANVTITDTDWHAIAPTARRKGGAGSSAPVKIGSGAWIGLGAIILKGVTIGPNSVIAAGSVVTKNVPPNVIAGGNPAIVLRPLENRHSKENLEEYECHAK